MRPPRTMVHRRASRVVLAAVAVVWLSSACSLPAVDPLEESSQRTAPATDLGAAAEQTDIPPREDEILTPQFAPVPPGAAIHLSAQTPQPGEYFSYQLCTVAYSFSLPDGRSIAVTASHCGKVGDQVWAADKYGEFSYPAEPVGQVVYSDFYAADTHHLDVAFIELNEVGTSGQIPFHSAESLETNVATQLAQLPEHACKLGGSTHKTCGEVTHLPELSKLNADGEQLESESARARMCARTGDSGGPVYAERDGRPVIIGLVSGTTERMDGGTTCEDYPGMEVSFTPAVEVQRLADGLWGEVARADAATP